MVAADAEADEGEVRVLALRRGRHLADLELAGDHLVPEVRDDLGDPLEPVAALVRDQDPERRVVFLSHP